MAFGQNRQEDLVAFLQRMIPQDRHDELVQDLTIDLSPPASEHRRESGLDDTVLHAEGQGRASNEDSAAQPAHAVARNLNQLESLLDAFSALQPQRALPKRHVSREVLNDLLDRFAALRPSSPASTDRLSSFRDLLDTYAELRSQERGSMRRA
jgi:hypothetical protein